MARFRGVSDIVKAPPVAALNSRSRLQAAQAIEPRITLGAGPLVAATTGLGLLLVAVADALNRSMTSSSQALFWLGLVVIYAPIVGRLAQASPRRLERLALVVLLGLGLYLVKVFRDPFGFTFADELVHAPNAESIVRTHHLFHTNAILQATPSYPGLESVTAALASLSGLSTFGAGLIVVGVARLLIVLALFLLVERLLGSARAAGLGVAIYAANSNFLFFSAQFSYESLALPLLVVVLYGYVEWRESSRIDRGFYRGALLLLIFAVVTTHHLASYALAVTLVVVSIAYTIVGSRYESPTKFALFAVGAAAVWLLVVASATVGYLSPVLTRAVSSVVHTISGEGAPRQLFADRAGRSDSGGSGPIGQVVAILGVGVLALLYLPGIRELWRTYRRDPFAMALGIGGGLVFVTYALRFAPDAWEAANRSTEFLFLGLALTLPLGILWLDTRLGRQLPLVAALALTLAFAAGVIAGWTPSLRLAQPYRIVAGDTTLSSENRAMASWAARTLGPGARYAASDADARLVNTYAGGFARAGRAPDVVDILRSETLDPWMIRLLRHEKIRYVAEDRRLRSFNNTSGYYFDFRSGPHRSRRLPTKVVTKFRDYDRIFDAGDVVIFDLGAK